MKADDEPDIQQPFNAILSILLILSEIIHA